VTSRRKSAVWITYPAARKGRRNTTGPISVQDIHRIRDAPLAFQLIACLADVAEFSGIIVNLGQTDRQGAALRPSERRECPDVFLQATRPPLTDDSAKTRRAIDRSNNSYEQSVLAAVGSAFSQIDRETAAMSRELCEAVAAHTPTALAYTDVSFSTYQSAVVSELRGGPKCISPADRFTLGYVLVSPMSLGPHAPTLVAAWTMGGGESLVFGDILRKRFAHRISAATSEGARRILAIRFAPARDVPYPFVSYDLDALDVHEVLDLAF
jgi:hypothetical protein